MGLSQDGKGFILFISIIVIAILILLVTVMLFIPIEYSASCSINGLSTGLDKELNFTGFNLNDSEIKCDISGEAPLILLLNGFG